MFASVSLRAHCHATEEPDKVRRALLFLAAMDEGRVREMRAAGHFGNQITVMEVVLSKRDEVDAFTARVMPSLPRHEMASTLEARLDPANVFHFRLDKQQACLGKVAMTSSGDPVHVRCTLKAKSRTEAARAVRETLGIVDGS